jgi:hypothetical protein
MGRFVVVMAKREIEVSELVAKDIVVERAWLS